MNDIARSIEEIESSKKIKLPLNKDQRATINFAIDRGLINYPGIEDLEKLHYHNLAHTLHPKEGVLAETALLCYNAVNGGYLNGDKQEDLDKIEEVLLAAIFHDIGYLIVYEKNEPKGAELAADFIQGNSIIFPDLFLGWGSQDQRETRINRVKSLIEGTEVPVNPGDDLMQQILCDADVANFGRDDFNEKGMAVGKEKGKFGEENNKSSEESLNDLLNMMDQYFYSPCVPNEWRKKLEENKISIRGVLDSVIREHTAGQ